MDYLESQLCFHLYVKTRDIIRTHDRHLKAISLTYPKALVLLSLEAKPLCYINEVGKKLSMDIGTLSPLLKKMEQDGHVTKQRDREDERKILITMTEIGRKKIAPIKQAFRKTSAMICLSDDERIQIMKLILAINIHKPIHKQTKRGKNESNIDNPTHYLWSEDLPLCEKSFDDVTRKKCSL